MLLLLDDCKIFINVEKGIFRNVGRIIIKFGNGNCDLIILGNLKFLKFLK